MFELLGIVFGGASRLTQHWMETRDKQNEREHEAVMFDKQVALQSQRFAAEKDLRQMDITAQRDVGELDCSPPRSGRRPPRPKPLAAGWPACRRRSGRWSRTG